MIRDFSHLGLKNSPDDGGDSFFPRIVYPSTAETALDLLKGQLAIEKTSDTTLWELLSKTENFTALPPDQKEAIDNLIRAELFRRETLEA